MSEQTGHQPGRGNMSRRSFLRVTGAALPAAVAACTPAATAPPQASTGGGEAWEQQWNDLVGAARKEGLLTLSIPLGAGYPRAMESFTQAFGGIEVEHSQMNATTFVPKVMGETKAGLHLYDVVVTSHAATGPTLYQAGLMEPLRPLLFRTDVLGDQNWRDGFETGFKDEEKQYAYSAFSFANYAVWINANTVREGEVKTYEDLLNPKWKGKIVSGDPKSNGAGNIPATALRLKYGEDIIRRLWKDQEVTLFRDNRQLVEQMVRGRFDIGIGLSNNIIEEFWDQGVGKNVKWIVVPPMMSASGGQDVIYLFKNRPHPSAAKLFLNWFLTREGQNTWATAGPNNSRRTDVEPQKPDQLPRPGLDYFHNDDFRNIDTIAETYKIAQRILS